MAAVRQWLGSRNVFTQNDWLEACINFVKEDNEGKQLSSVQLNELVYEQWLMAEIDDSSLPRLPEGLGNRDICKLEGNFNLQINSVLNVGESAYSQIQKLKGQDDPQELNYRANPSEPKIKPSRMLLLELTDGTQTVYGMEYQLIPSLKVNTPPGTKIQVSGHITCRLGALLLTPSNVKVLGGKPYAADREKLILEYPASSHKCSDLLVSVGQDPPEKPGVIKTEALGNEETNVNQITIHDNAASDVITYNDANRRNNSTAGLSNNNHIGNTGNSEHKGQLKQQRPRVPRGIQGAVPTNSSRDFKNGGINSKMEKVENQDFFDDDDDILAAVADDDYFALEEDFDMEQIDQLEMGLQNNSHATANKQTTNSNMITHENEDIELPYDDEIFEVDFVEEDLLAEAADSFEIKPLHQRICNEESLGITHRSKNSRISNSSSMEFSSHARNSSSTSNTTNIQTPSDVDFRQPKDANCTLNNVKTEPISQTITQDLILVVLLSKQG
ncbi:recQ-mediated genome instability protein 1 [Desmophyllum pertusum]|uniref:RecQ-mediated genome instability protein 1 n=1 Tax=Desmophyllum pertusum TaxID=174260 RepID=A0A9X0A6I8_9CNID|nr:recQ-mediated genome instability protein 1 [Desmophyllum pertusum]